MAAQPEAIYGMTPLQEGMLFEGLLSPANRDHVVQSSFRLPAQLDFDVVERAWTWAFQRHAALRTCFAWKAVDRPLQVVLPRVPAGIQRLDWRGLGEAGEAERVAELFDQDRQRGFDFAKAPLSRLYLIDLTSHQRLVWSYHHILLDGWSRALVLAEVAVAYELLARGVEPNLEPPPPFEDYVQWLRRRDLAAAERFWRDGLAGFDQLTPLPTGDSPPSPRQGPGAQAVRLLSQSVTAATQELASRARVTLSSVVHAGWALLLARHADRDDVVFGTVVSGRPPELAGVESMVGLFINTLPLRVRVTAGARIDAWLREVQDGIGDLRQFEYSPLALVQRWSGLPARTRLFESVLVFENYPRMRGERPPDALKIDEEPAVESVGYPLALFVGPGPRLELKLLHDTNRVSPRLAERLLAELELLLVDMSAAPEATLDGLSLTHEQSSRRVEVGANETRVDWEGPTCLHELVAEQAQRTPHRTAVTAVEGSLTYTELNRRSAQLAARLRSLGVGPEARVGICLDRSPELVVGMLGVLRAGGAYVPMDPSYPPARLRHMLDDSGAKWLLSERSVLPHLPSTSAEVVLLDGQGATNQSRGTEPPAPGVDPENLAYVTYTSGSTGVPKGVAISHRALVNLIQSVKRSPGLTADDVLVAVTPISFDIAALELYLPLVSGATVVLASRQTAADGWALARLLKASGATVMQATPQTWELLVAAGWEGGLNFRALCGGEALPVGLARRLAARVGELWNLYGPTETTVWSTAHRVEPGEGGVPIGRPVANTTALVLDRQLGTVTSGATGDIYLGGLGLARGYFGQPALTATRFVPSPFGPPGARLYRTGDLGRYRADAALEFVGRTDHQVKLRGHRIELGEIEAVLESLPHVRRAAVVVRGKGSEASLAAYITAAPGASDPAAVRSRLRERLPDFMFPASIEYLPELPLTPNGKLDRKALPEPAQGGGAAPSAAHGPVPELLAAIWSELLGTQAIGPESDFFELGGHSLTAMRLSARIRRTLGVELPLAELFEAPRLLDAARRVERRLGLGQRTLETPIPRLPRNRSMPLSPIQREIWRQQRSSPSTAVFNLPAAVRMKGPLEPRLVELAMEAVAHQHEALRSRFPSRSGEPRAEVLSSEELNVEVDDVSSLPNEDRERRAAALAQEEAERPFDLERGPLVRCRLVRLDESDHLIVWTLHHLIADGWSRRILMEQMAAAYQALAVGAEPALTAPGLDYADYAAWQSERWRGQALESRVEHWRRKLEGTRALPEPPTDRPRPELAAYSAEEHRFTVREELMAGLRALSRRESVTLFGAILTAFQALLCRRANRDKVVVGTLTPGRERLELETVIGPFVNSIPLIGDFSGDPTVREMLRRNRDEEVDAFLDPVPHELLEEALNAPGPTRVPIYNATFVLENLPPAQVDPGPFQIEPHRLATRFIRQDMTLRVEESGQAVIEYRSDLFQPASIAEMAHELLVLLEAMVSDPERRISELAQVFRREVRTPWPLVEISNGSGTRDPLFLVHPVGGQVLCYRALARHLGEDQPVFGLLGRDDLEDSATIEEVAAGCVEAVVAKQPSGSVLLGGWSYGGVVAYEMARHLRAAGREVEMVVLIDATPPLLAPTAGSPAEMLAHLGLGEVSPSAADEAWLGRLYSGYRARKAALARYRPGAYDGRVLLFRAAELPAAARLERVPSENRWMLLDAGLGWAAHCARVEVMTAPGNHDTVLTEPRVARLAEMLKGRLDNIAAPSASA